MICAEIYSYTFCNNLALALLGGVAASSYWFRRAYRSFSRVGDDIGSGPIDHGIVSRTSVDMALVVADNENKKSCLLYPQRASGDHEDPLRGIQSGDYYED